VEEVSVPYAEHQLLRWSEHIPYCKKEKLERHGKEEKISMVLTVLISVRMSRGSYL
jgi:hypothetical protein